MSALGSGLATGLRLGAGGRAGGIGPRPTGELVLYQFDACPFCRKVREALVWLDLDVLVRPCPPRGARFRAGHGPPYPLLVDDGVEIRESSDIVRHLAACYGQSPVPWVMRMGPLTDFTCGLASLVLPRLRVTPSRAPDGPLELFSDETSAGGRELRRWLCALEIPYRWRTCGRGSAKLAELVSRTGSADLPALLDPGPGIDVRGAELAVAHLRRSYAG